MILVFVNLHFWSRSWKVWKYHNGQQLSACSGFWQAKWWIVKGKYKIYSNCSVQSVCVAEQ